MQIDETHQKYGIKLFRRRLSIVEKPTWHKQYTEREQLKQKCQQFLKSRRNQTQDSPFSPQSTSINKIEQVNNSMPSIRMFRQEKHKVGEALRQTISKYNYINNQKQKQLQNLNRRKLKYQKVLKIRQDHIKQKMSMNQSRILLQRQMEEQKLRLKRSVDIDKMIMDKSRVRNLDEKKLQGEQRRREENRNRNQIKNNILKDLDNRKKLHSSIVTQQKSLKDKKLAVSQKRKILGAQHYYQKLYKELTKIQNLQKKQQTIKSLFSSKIEQLQRSKKILDQKMKGYEFILKDGSTLKKIKPKLKINGVGKSSIISSNRIKTQSNSDDIIF